MSQGFHAYEFDPALIARYGAAERHADCSTALPFHADFDEAALRAAIRDSNEEPIPRPLSVQVSVPFCLTPCFYCDSGCERLTADATEADRYLERLYREIGLIAPLFDRDRSVRELQFGGGTSNFLDIARMRELMESLARHFSFSHEASRDYGIEIDPRFADAAYVRALGELGFNRVSVGVHDFDPQVQQAIGRIQSLERTREVIEAARTAHFRSIGVDLIYGMPKQGLDRLSHTLAHVVALAPDRITVCGYAHVPQMFTPQRQVDVADLPDSATRLALLGHVLEQLSGAGYVYLGMNQFVRVDDELAVAQRAGRLRCNFRDYSTQGECDTVGLGLGAISRVGDCYSQNARDLIGYYAALDAGRLPVARGLMVGEDDLIRRELVGTLMCRGELDKQAFGRRHQLLFDKYFARERQRLRPLLADGLVQEDACRLRVTARGRLLLHAIARCFDAHAREVAHIPSTPRPRRSDPCNIDPRTR
ncbi:oxygen-independent coproporphyrinogen III oxidase [Rhodanobacter ginsengisoli]|uniref:Coproporphyrinogen-III oxidase n=1 Tax=Rhodanobacter ginsengisoli TaxID=418646 RepID=A0ABW0QKH5_9GAMM